MRRFRHLRRLTAVVAQLLLLQLVLASGAGACPLGDGAMSTMGASMTDAGAAHGEHHGVAAHALAAHDVAPADVPHHTGEQCHMACPVAVCAVAGHCTVTATVHRASDLRPHGAGAGHLPTASDAVPHLRRAAPEPPPPRPGTLH